MFYLYFFLANLALTTVLLFLVRWLFPKWGWLDRPHRYGLKRAPIPYYAGTVIFLVFALNILIFMPLDKHYYGLLLGALLVVVTSVVDDAISLSPILRLGMQALAALILVGSGIGIDFITLPGGHLLRLDWWNMPLGAWGQLTFPADLFTIIWVMLIMNTLNWLDGIPGLVSGVSSISGGVIFGLSLILIGVNTGLGDWGEVFKLEQIALMSLCLCAAAVAFWRFDFFPPKLLMGDSGTMFMGYILAALAIFSGGKVATILMILGFPILDVFWVVLRRVFVDKKSPLKGDLFHFHHRLMYAGLSERQALSVIYLFCLCFGAAALFLDTLGKFLALIFMFVVMVLVGSWVVRRGRAPAAK